MKNLVTIQNNQAVVNSRQVAEHFEKRHDNVIQNIEGIIKTENSVLTKMFIESSYQAGTGKNYKVYLMNRDGFTLLAMSFTGKKALEWKLKYITAFNEMEEKLKLTSLPDFANPVVAARAWADEVEAKQIAQKQIQLLQPKANYYDKYLNTEELSTITSIGMLRGLSTNKTFSILRQAGWLNKPANMQHEIGEKAPKGVFKKVYGIYNNEKCATIKITLKGVNKVLGLIDRYI